MARTGLTAWLGTGVERKKGEEAGEVGPRTRSFSGTQRAVAGERGSAAAVAADAEHQVAQRSGVQRRRQERAARLAQEAPRLRVAQVVGQEDHPVLQLGEQLHHPVVQLRRPQRSGGQLDDHDVEDPLAQLHPGVAGPTGALDLERRVAADLLQQLRAQPVPGDQQDAQRRSPRFRSPILARCLSRLPHRPPPPPARAGEVRRHEKTRMAEGRAGGWFSWFLDVINLSTVVTARRQLRPAPREVWPKYNQVGCLTQAQFRSLGPASCCGVPFQFAVFLSPLGSIPGDAPLAASGDTRSK